MKHTIEGVSATKVPMVPVPGALIEWDRTEVDSASGALYTSPACPPELAARVLKYSGLSPAPWKLIGRGLRGNVYKSKGVAIKRFGGQGISHTERFTGLDTLRANVAMHVSLADQESARLPLANVDATGIFRFSAPQLFAGFIPYDDAKASVRAVWAMDLISGRRPKSTTLPLQRAMHQHFVDALDVCGIGPNAIDFDDYNGVNLLENRRSAPGVTDIVKIDVMANTKLIN